MIHYGLVATLIFVSIIATYYTTKWKYEKRITELNKRNASNHTLFKSKNDTLCMALEEKSNQLVLSEIKFDNLKVSFEKIRESIEETRANLTRNTQTEG